MPDDTEAKAEWKPPYFTYSTLNTFIDKKCASHPIPPRIDKTFIDNVAGGVQPLLLSALRLIGFTTESGDVRPLLHEAAKSQDSRKAIVREWAASFYSEQIALAESNATPQMLADSFSRSGYQGSTLRKAIVFYLALTDDVGLPRSPHFKAPKQNRSPSGGTGGRSKDKAKDTVEESPPQARPDAPAGERKDIDLGAPGTVTIFVDVKWLDLPDETFMKLREAIRELESLRPKELPVATAEPDSESEEDSDG